MISWLEAHDRLSGWAQFLGAMLTLAVTYLTAFAPGWRRKRQLRETAKRLLANGYEVVESFHRTSAYFAPFPQSLRQAALPMTSVVDEVRRFPIFELDEQVTSLSLARRLSSMSMTLGGLALFLETTASQLGDRAATTEEHELIRTFARDRLTTIEALVVGAPLVRPEWPVDAPAGSTDGNADTAT